MWSPIFFIYKCNLFVTDLELIVFDWLDLPPLVFLAAATGSPYRGTGSHMIEKRILEGTEIADT